MRKLFNGGMVAMVLDGSMRLEPRDGFLLGNGNFSVFTPLTKKDMINLRLNLLADGIDLKAVVKRRQQELICEVFLPLLQGAGSKVQKNMLSNALRCRIYGSMELKDLLELTDKLDIRGSVNCDMRIGGSMANPVVHGNLTVRKARIAVNDMILKNGTISLSGNNGNNLTMVGEFIDSSKNKLTLSGGGKFIFNDFVPNVETDLQLRFGNYKLFDTDNISIVVSGIGKIAGTIENLQIGGDVVIPRCKIQKFDADDACKKDDIIIENEIRVKRKSDQKETDQKNFFRYDIKAHCPQINFSGNVFEMTLQGNLHISTYDHQQTMAGRLKIMKGKLDLFGKRMEMINGYAEFLPEFQFDPKMKFVCTRNFGDIVVYFDMENTPERGVSFDLYSTPNYSKDVILSNMLFGKDLKYLSVSEAAQMAHVLASFNSHGYIFSVLNTFQNIGIIDSLSFTSSDKRTHSLNVDKSSSSENGVNVSAGKYVNDNVYISINKTSEGATFDVDLSLTPKISVKANTAGEAGISWKYRY
jgi:translocation and assembly module TamB